MLGSSFFRSKFEFFLNRVDRERSRIFLFPFCLVGTGWEKREVAVFFLSFVIFRHSFLLIKNKSFFTTPSEPIHIKIEDAVTYSIIS